MKKIFTIIITLLILTSCSKETKITPYFCPEDNCSDQFLKEIKDAEEINCALYSLNEERIENQLKEKNAKIVIEEYKEITKNTIKDKNPSLMHNKFCILDKTKVITGSFNPNKKENLDILLIIESKEVAKKYTKEFKEIWIGEIGKKERKKETYPEIYFCPEDNCKEKVIEELSKAKTEIKFLFFSFTDKDIANLLIHKSKEIEVKGVMEKNRVTHPNNQYKHLKENKIKVYPDNQKILLHHKTIIIDNKIILTGSYNPTNNGNKRNDENLIIIKNPEIAKEFKKEFQKIFIAALQP